MKYTLAIEQSTVTPSIALLGDNKLLGETSWQVSRKTPERMFSAIDELLTKNEIKPADITLFAIGLGPGNFTGLRTSLSTIQAMALPTHTDIIGISSAEAIAHSTQSPVPSPRTLVAGDARRRRLWLGTFETTQGALQPAGEFELVPMDELSGKIQSGDTIVTPDWETLETELSAIVPHSATLISKSQIPTAATIAALANLRKTNKIPSNPLKPIYMHPPVFIEPRFTEETKRRI